MPFIRSAPDYLLVSEAAAAAFTAGRLLYFGLLRKFPYLLGYLLADILLGLALSMLRTNSYAYYYTYFYAVPVCWVAQALAVQELFTLIFRDYPGIRTIGWWTFYAAVGLSIVVCVFAASALGAHDRPTEMYYHLVLDRSISFSLGIVIMVLMFVLARYPLNLDRNSLVVSVFFSGLFMAEAAIKLRDSLAVKVRPGAADRIEVALEILCFMAWGALLRPARASAPVRKPDPSPREEHLLQQLDNLNLVLSRSARQ